MRGSFSRSRKTTQSREASKIGYEENLPNNLPKNHLGVSRTVSRDFEIISTRTRANLVLHAWMDNSLLYPERYSHWGDA